MKITPYIFGAIIGALVIILPFKIFLAAFIGYLIGILTFNHIKNI